MHLLIILNPSLCVALLIVDDMCYINFLYIQSSLFFSIYMLIVRSHRICIVCVVVVS